MSELGFNILRSSNALLLRYSEDWDHQTYLQRFGETLLDYTKTFDTDRWAAIDDISNWPVKPPDEVEMCSELAEVLVDSGMTHVAVFGSELAVSVWMMENIFPDTVALKFFDTLEASKAWLAENGFDTEFQSML